MTTAGIITVTIVSHAAIGLLSGLPNLASTSIDNNITYGPSYCRPGQYYTGTSCNNCTLGHYGDQIGLTNPTCTGYCNITGYYCVEGTYLQLFSFHR
jgi:hypothetical protein